MLRVLNCFGWSALLMVSLFIYSSGLSAQQLAPDQSGEASNTEISDEQIMRFVDISKKINGIQQQAQMEMVSIIQGHGLDVNKFNQMAQQKQNPQADPALSISDQDKLSFDNAMKDLEIYQMEVQQQMEALVIKGNLELDEFNAIMQAYQQNPEIQQKVNELMNTK